jgi:hypothetical protein|tara:strand:+ start:1547 stop:1753 length:207 start_codon:yes stop_codon:yes gene_type:complete
MSIMDDLDWGLDNDDYGTKESKADPKSLGGYKRWTSASDREATTKKSKSKEFLSTFKSKFKDKFRDSR